MYFNGWRDTIAGSVAYPAYYPLFGSMIFRQWEKLRLSKFNLFEYFVEMTDSWKLLSVSNYCIFPFFFLAKNKVIAWDYDS